LAKAGENSPSKFCLECGGQTKIFKKILRVEMIFLKSLSRKMATQALAKDKQSQTF